MMARTLVGLPDVRGKTIEGYDTAEFSVALHFIDGTTLVLEANVDTSDDDAVFNITWCEALTPRQSWMLGVMDVEEMRVAEERAEQTIAEQRVLREAEKDKQEARRLLAAKTGGFLTLKDFQEFYGIEG